MLHALWLPEITIRQGHDTMDKVDARSLAIVGHVLVETVPALEKKLRRSGV
jgi:hypothetical protein